MTELIQVDQEENLPSIIEMNPSAEVDADIQEARQTYKDLISQGKAGLDVAFELMQASEHPRAIEVFAGLINNLSSINSKLVDLQKVKHELANVNPEVTNNTQNITNNYIGSPADLQKLLNGE